ICAVITEETVASARAAIKRAASVADMIEMRLDYLRDFDFTSQDRLRALLEDNPLPAIITCRAVSEGGMQFVEDATRLRLLVEGARHLADYCDIEAASYAEAAQLSPDLRRLIVSYHNFVETPADLDGVYERITELPAAIHKIATKANLLTDTLPIFRLLDRAQSEGRDLIAIAIGEAGLMTRIIGPARGSFLTYASVEEGRGSAPGQLTCEELRNVYRAHHISRETVITGIIGKPVAHSASPAMHNRAFAALGLDFVYQPIEVSDVTDFFLRFANPQTRELDWRLRGFSVTIPHKTSVAAHLDELDPVAQKAGAVNTVVIDGEKLSGYNTDVEGAMKPLERECALEGVSCGVIGAGGAARAVVCGLVLRGALVRLFARDTAKARMIAEAFGVPVSPIESLESSDVEIVINATPIGMKGHSENTSPVPRSALEGRRVAYDLVYNPLETRFLRDALEAGCRAIPGVEMLVEQAALQFELWTGRRPPVDLMRAAALEKLAAQSK
ncbi:MAG TPA: shikimate dehydrogenase, partial [Blastocatellia bacterium]|nr:shikimate dehydrogenase [Blastocatellia bacterium]